MLVKNHVNVVNTPTWVKLNEDARKKIYRNQFIKENGGEFKNVGLYVQWIEKEDYSSHPDRYVVKTPDNDLEIIEVFSKFCREKNLNKAAMYGTLKGTRNHHKGYKLVKVPDLNYNK